MAVPEFRLTIAGMAVIPLDNVVTGSHRDTAVLLTDCGGHKPLLAFEEAALVPLTVPLTRSAVTYVAPDGRTWVLLDVSGCDIAMNPKSLGGPFALDPDKLTIEGGNPEQTLDLSVPGWRSLEYVTRLDDFFPGATVSASTLFTNPLTSGGVTTRLKLDRGHLSALPPSSYEDVQYVWPLSTPRQLADGMQLSYRPEKSNEINLILSGAENARLRLRAVDPSRLVIQASLYSYCAWTNRELGNKIDISGFQPFAPGLPAVAPPPTPLPAPGGKVRQGSEKCGPAVAALV